MRSRNANDDAAGRALSRRGVLRLAAGATLGVPAAALTGCGLFDRGEKPPPAPDPLAPLLASAWELAARHDAAAAAHPDLSARLTPLAEAHRAHAAELARITGTTPPTTTPSGGTRSAEPGDAKTTLAGLRSAEREGQAAAAEACRTAPGARAALLGSIAAARATHVEVLK
ncbi:hypothetical protein [Micromonospora sp. NPDC049679]|uniref:hypothetical protein n=1 Tax=Micromonospora sp. NPDC049679 TaxID=3155920 RepID=UPI0033D08AE1